ncbi:MAG: hypothetical protein ACREBS_06735 [Nitrososphaerales archaeon]
MQSRRIFYLLIAASLVITAFFSPLIGLILLAIAIVYYYRKVKVKPALNSAVGVDSPPKDGGPT